MRTPDGPDGKNSLYRHQPARSRMRRFVVQCDNNKRRIGQGQGQGQGEPLEALEAMETEGVVFSSKVIVLDSVLPPFMNFAAMKTYLDTWGDWCITWLDPA